jgi:hypothetical protein
MGYELIQVRTEADKVRRHHYKSPQTNERTQQ